ncbi:MAG: class D sortase [Oscillospiraceae bacterium]|nr:class D sortase [Oscillospiraceae bacterium]
MKKLTMLFSVLCLTLALTVPASALEYDIDGPGDPEYGKSTSIEPVVTADHGEMPNVDVSKNAALIPPTFGSASAYTLNTGTPLTPNLAPGYMMGEGAVINGSAGITVAPPDFGNIPSGGTSSGNTATTTPSTGYTEVTSDLYYSGGYLATLKIPSLNVNVKVYEGTGSSILAKGAGHFDDTSIWDGNCCIAGHNRGTNCYFGEIHNLNVGDTITLTTKLGTRTYSVTSVNKISETDNSLLAPTAENCITLFTCVRNQSAYRWAVRAVEV